MLDGTSPYYGEPLSPPQVERVVSGTTTTRLERALLLIQQAVRLRLRRRRPPLAWLELEAERPPDEGACAACCPSGRALPPRRRHRPRHARHCGHSPKSMMVHPIRSHPAAGTRT